MEDATQWPWDVAKLTAALMFGVGLIAVLIPEVLRKIFLTNEDAIRVATWPLRFTGITVAGDALSLTMQNALLGVGDAARVAMGMGADVTVVEVMPTIMPVEDEDIYKTAQKQMEKQGLVQLGRNMITVKGK